MITDATLDTLADAVVAAAPSLDRDQRRIALATYRQLATGGAATASAIAERCGVPPDVVARQLDSWSGVFFDHERAVVGFWGLAIPEMPHRIRSGGVDLHAWCAWDPLFLAHILGDLDVETDDPVTGDTISYRIDGSGAIDRPSHPRTVVSFLVPDGTWGADVIATFCHHVLHFTDRGTGERWVAQRPGSILLSLPEAAELGRRFVERVYGSEHP